MKKINVLKDAKLGDVIKSGGELIEVGFDHFIKNSDILKDIPIISSIFAALKGIDNISNVLFLKKIQKFLIESQDISSDKKDDLIRRIDSDSKYKTKVGETILMIIDKHNDYSKSVYLGKLFRELLLGNIDYDIFLKLSNIIDRCFIPDLNDLMPLYNKENISIEAESTLYGLGLLNNLGIDGQLIISDNRNPPKKRNIFEMNNYGKLITEIILKNQI